MADFPETLARAVFQAAIREARCAQLLECLFDGGTATVDAKTRELVIIPASAMAHLVADQTTEVPEKGPVPPPCEACDENQRLLVGSEGRSLARLKALRAANSRWKNARRDFLAVKAEKDTVVDELTWLRARVDEFVDAVGQVLAGVDPEAEQHPVCLTHGHVALLNASVAAVENRDDHG